MKKTAALLAGAALMMTLNTVHANAYTIDYSHALNGSESTSENGSQTGRHAASYWLGTADLNAASKDKAEVLLEKLNKYFGPWRGSVVSHNKHSVFNRDTQVKSSTGYEVITESAVDDSQVTPSTNLDVNLLDLTSFDAPEIKRTEYTFETDSIEEGTSAAPVPEPGTIVLFGAGMLGMAFYGKQRRTQYNL